MSSVTISTIGDNVRLLSLDMPGKSANVLTDSVYQDLDEALREIENQAAGDPDDAPRGIIVVSAKPSIYIAGADLRKISDNLDWPDERIFQFCEHGRSIMSRLSQLPNTVSVAAIHGICVGGGLELPLWCDHRIATDSRRTLLGLPEVKLGLIPGWAGTVRLPRLIGLQPAFELTASGDLISAQESLDLGLVSLVVPQANLIETALQIIDREHYTKGYLKKREVLAAHVKKKPKSIRQFRQSSMESIQANTDVDANAPTILLEHMIKSAKQSAAEACLGESAAFAEVWGSQPNRGLLHYFFLDERSKKTQAQFKGEAPEITNIGIVGAGLMGGQIAALAATAGFDLRIFDADHRRSAELARSISDSAGCRADSVESVQQLDSLADCHLIIECIVEKLKVKQDLFQRLGKIVSDDTFLATNTSTIPVHEIAQLLPDPSRLAGLHFCIPSEPLKLVEVIRGDQTSDIALNVAIEFVRVVRKTPVVVHDQPGFVVNRLLAPMFSQAISLLQHGQSIERIDGLFREFGFAAGPFEMIDFIGVDTIMYAGETFLRTDPDLVSLTPILPALVKNDRLGRKVGRGFYQYDAPDQTGTVDDPVRSLIEKYRNDPNEIADQEILDQLLWPMADQARHVLDAGVVSDPRDVDLCSILGTTFPKSRGGILFWADSQTALSAPTNSQ